MRVARNVYDARYVSDFLSVIGLLFSFLIGNTFVCSFFFFLLVDRRLCGFDARRF